MRLTTSTGILLFCLIIFAFVFYFLVQLANQVNQDIRFKASQVAQEKQIVKIHAVAYLPPLPENPTLINHNLVGDGFRGKTILEIKTKIENDMIVGLDALQKGSQFQQKGIISPNNTIEYQVEDSINYYYEELPLADQPISETEPVYRPKYFDVLNRENICHKVDEKGISQIWLWGYHNDFSPPYLVPTESNMAMGRISQDFFNMPQMNYGDVSNSERTDDLPVCNHTYTLFNYNLARGPAEMVENQTHHIEDLLNWIDGRDILNNQTLFQRWPELLFWGHFVGSDSSRKSINPGCGWTHYPPNGISDYDWRNSNPVASDCEDWNPQRSGEKIAISCNNWKNQNTQTCQDDGGLAFKIWWMRHLPQAKTDLHFANRKLSNWWRWITDFDGSLTAGGALLTPDTNPVFTITQNIDQVIIARSPAPPTYAPLTLQTEDSQGNKAFLTQIPESCNQNSCEYRFSLFMATTNNPYRVVKWRILWDRYVANNTSGRVINNLTQAWAFDSQSSLGYKGWFNFCSGGSCPTPTPSPTLTPLPTPTPTPTPLPTPRPTISPTPQPSPSITPWPTPSSQPTPWPTFTPTPQPTPRPTPTLRPTPTPTPRPTPNPSPTTRPTPTPTPRLTPIPTPRPTPILTPTPQPTPRITPRPTPQPTITPAPTQPPVCQSILDQNIDGFIDFNDLVTYLMNYRQKSMLADYNCDRNVLFNDLMSYLIDWRAVRI